MDTPPVVYPRTRIRTRVDHASLALLRSVMAEGWKPEKAARDLLAVVRGDRRVLVLVHAKLSRATLDRPTRITERAALTVQQALAAADRGPGQAVIPAQGGAHA
jgi:hypothetical protein